MRRLVSALPLLLVACANPSEDAWTGYLFGDVISGEPMTIAGPFGTLAQCRAEMRTRLSRMPAGAGYSCGQGCAAPREGRVADCGRTAR